MIFMEGSFPMEKIDVRILLRDISINAMDKVLRLVQEDHSKETYLHALNAVSRIFNDEIELECNKLEGDVK